MHTNNLDQEQMQNNQTLPYDRYSLDVNNALWSLQGQNATYPPGHMPSATMPQNTLSSTPQSQPQPSPTPSSVINLSNSSDVVIGPMTQYQGPVTIYQYMDATLDSRTSQSRGAMGLSGNNRQSPLIPKLTTSSKLLVLLIILVIIVSGIVLYYEIFRPNNDTSRQPILFGNNYDHETFPNLGNGHLIVNRVQWGASELAKLVLIKLKHPVPYVIITHIGVQSVPCTNIYKCSIKMRTIQDSAIAEKNIPDIQSNFYVAGDGNIYVGRGWNLTNTYANDTLAVTFMGDYERYIPTDNQLDATKYLLAYALTNKYITLDYKLVAQNQTKKSRSPGTNVYKQIKSWPHFFPCGMDGNAPCGAELNMPLVWDAKQ